MKSNVLILTAFLVALVSLVCIAQDKPAPKEKPPTPTPNSTKKIEGVVRVPMLVYDKGKTGKCFAERFLNTLGRKTKINVDRKLASVEMGSQQLYQYPIVIFTGQGPFELSALERINLKAYIKRGGFVLASSGCSNDAWETSFRKEIAKIMPENKPVDLTTKHALFHTVFDIDRVVAKTHTNEKMMQGLKYNGRLAIVFSPLGLNDTANAGKGCCCCGGNEIRDAHLINANIVAYALTH
jgi:hypothetical protein